MFFFFFQAEDGIRDYKVTGVQTCALPIWPDELDAERDQRAHQPAPEPRLAPGPLEEPEDAREERAAEEGGEPEALHEVRPERLGRRPVEAEALLDDERRPPAGGDRQDRPAEA